MEGPTLFDQPADRPELPLTEPAERRAERRRHPARGVSGYQHRVQRQAEVLRELGSPERRAQLAAAARRRTARRRDDPRPDVRAAEQARRAQLRLVS